MHWMQISETNSIEEMQTFRIGRWQEEKGPDDSILDYDINFVLKIELTPVEFEFMQINIKPTVYVLSSAVVVLIP